MSNETPKAATNPVSTPEGEDSLPKNGADARSSSKVASKEAYEAKRAQEKLKSDKRKTELQTHKQEVEYTEPKEPLFVRAKRFFMESRTELSKVTWPTGKDVKLAGFAVFLMVLITSLFLSVVDFSLSKLVNVILSQ